jgi:hypothetical protein
MAALRNLAGGATASPAAATSPMHLVRPGRAMDRRPFKILNLTSRS